MALKSIEKNQGWAAFTVINYDSFKCLLSVYGPKGDSHQIKDFCQTVLTSQMKEDLSHEINVPVFNGTAIVSLGSGVNVNKIMPGTSIQLRFSVEIEIKTKEEFINWLCNTANLKNSDVVWCNFIKRKADDEKACAIVGFSDEIAANRARELKQASFQYSQEEMSKTIAITIPHTSFNGKQLEDKLKNLPIPPSKVFEPSPPYFQISLQNYYNKYKTIEETKRALSDYNFENLVDIDIRGKKIGVLKFTTKESRDFAHKKLTANYWSTNVNDFELKHKVFIRFSRTEDAQNFYKLGKANICPSALEFEGSETARVERAHLFPRLNEYLVSICTNLKCKFEIKVDKKYIKNKSKKDTQITKVYFSGASPIIVGQAAKQLLKTIAPLSMKFGTIQQRTLMKEINELELFDEWDQNFGLEHKVFEDDKTGEIFKLEIYGDQMKQGAYMAKILEYSDTFNPRFQCVPVPNSLNFLFKKNMLGGNFMQKLNKEIGHDGKISFANFENVVEIYVKPEIAKSLENIIKKVQVFIKEHSSDCEQKSLGEDTFNSCVYCQKPGGQPLSLCGHHFCSNCLSDEIKSKIQRLECKTCRTPISMRDIKFCLSEEDFSIMAQNAVKAYLSENNDSLMTPCPGANCQVLKETALGYKVCPWCETGYCPLCGEQNNTFHEGKTCQEYREFRKTMEPCPNRSCGVLREKKLGYSQCPYCRKCSCPICGEIEKRYHLGKTCLEYQELLKNLMPCPNPSCGFLRDKNIGYSLCENCHIPSCPQCGEQNKVYHQNRSCKEYREILKTLIACPTRGCLAMREMKNGYSRCATCNTSNCPFCGVKEQPLHQNKACKDFENMLKDCIPCPNSNCKTMREK